MAQGDPWGGRGQGVTWAALQGPFLPPRWVMKLLPRGSRPQQEKSPPETCLVLLTRGVISQVRAYNLTQGPHKIINLNVSLHQAVSIQ